MAHTTDNLGGQNFRSTHWSVIREAASNRSGQSTQAWQELCKAYWPPLYAFIRRRQNCSPENAKDLTQEFFVHLLGKHALEGLHQEGGKFRSWLQTVCVNFLNSQYRHEQAIKRGGGKQIISIDDTVALRYQSELAETMTPEDWCDRQWAMLLLDRVLARLQAKYKAQGKENLFVLLRNCLPGGDGQNAYAALAAQSGMTQDSLREAALRLRKRYRALLRNEIATTVSSREEIDDELRHLRSVLS